MTTVFDKNSLTISIIFRKNSRSEVEDRKKKITRFTLSVGKYRFQKGSPV